jgi:hypothetical protein
MQGDFEVPNLLKERPIIEIQTAFQHVLNQPNVNFFGAAVRNPPAVETGRRLKRFRHVVPPQVDTQ